MNSSNNNLVYLDAAATTPVDPEVIEVMISCMKDKKVFGNPSAMNPSGRNAMRKIDKARKQLGDLIGVNASDLIWTSGATESNNLAILGAARYRANIGRHLITMSTEHKAVLGAFDSLEKEGFEVTKLSPDSEGLLDLQDLENAIRDDTQIISIMHVNNETGVMQDIEKIGSLCRQYNVLFHCDAAQSVGKIPLDLNDLSVDLLSVSAHKFYGPQGIGALYIKDINSSGLVPLFYGGEQENWIRPGTLPLHQIVGFGLAAELAKSRLDKDYQLMCDLHDYLWEGVMDISGIIYNGSRKSKFPGILNVSAPKVNGESLLFMLDSISVAQGSACNSTNNEPSLVLRELGLNDHQIQAAIRFSFTRYTTKKELDIVIQKYLDAVKFLRKITPDDM
ncbi:MAG: cysteine desulfurase family protein [Pseudomonadota bacterium]|nr:cysteine desulfurase family protein [Pseudomonadota bacterium]